MRQVNEVRHRTNDAEGQTNGRPLTVDNDRADMMRALLFQVKPSHHDLDLDAFARADADPWDPLYDPMEQLGDPCGALARDAAAT